MKFSEYKKQIYNKVYTSIRVKTFISLLTKFSSTLSIYLTAYKSLKFLREDDTNNSKRKELEDKIKYAKNEIKSLHNQIEEFFNEGFFQEITKEQADSISDEYQHLVEIIVTTKNTLINDSAWHIFTDLIDTYENIIVPIFKILNDNIDIYNNKADENGWKYKLRSFDEAIDYHNKNYAVIDKNFL